MAGPISTVERWNSWADELASEALCLGRDRRSVSLPGGAEDIQVLEVGWGGSMITGGEWSIRLAQDQDWMLIAVSGGRCVGP